MVTESLLNIHKYKEGNKELTNLLLNVTGHFWFVESGDIIESIVSFAYLSKSSIL